MARKGPLFVGSVAANIDYSLVSERWYFFLQLCIGPTDLFMLVPRNDAIFSKLRAKYQPILAVTDLPKQNKF